LLVCPNIEKTPTGEQRHDEATVSIHGLNLVWGFKYAKDNRWVGGKIYDPDNGKTYSCKMNLEGDELKVRGYIGFSLIGRTTVWNRKQ